MPDNLTERITYTDKQKKVGFHPAFFFALFFAVWQAAFLNRRIHCQWTGTKQIVMEKLVSIVNGTVANMVHVCNGKVIYQIQTGSHLYQLELDSNQQEWETTYLLPSFKSITLMRWIRKGLENRDGTFIQLK